MASKPAGGISIAKTGWSDEKVHQALGQISEQYTLLQCAECASALRKWLKRNGIRGKLWRISTRYDNEDFILSDRLAQQGISESITENGRHYGVEARGKIFDNLGIEGMEFELWLQDFHSISDEFDVELVDKF